MDGVIAINKPQGMTSHDVVDFTRRRFGIKKAGHAGTLDPMATGVLVLLLGKCTKLSGRFTNTDKEYTGRMVLGATSDTGDAWGNIKRRDAPTAFSREDIEAAFRKFLGPIEQTPPAFSAVKYKGYKLYELARRGVRVKVEPRKVLIEELRVLDVAVPEIAFTVKCSKGTYVRRLASDIGEELGCGAYLSKLHRTHSGGFAIDDAIAFDDLKAMGREELEKRLVIMEPHGLTPVVPLFTLLRVSGYS